MANNQQSFREMWETIKCTNIHIMGGQGEKRRENQKIIEETMKNFIAKGIEKFIENINLYNLDLWELQIE